MVDINNLFPALEKWRDDKLKDLCYCVATFFNFLATPRPGFLKVEINGGPSTVNPVITREMAVYVLGEIFPCNDMIVDTRFSPGDVPDVIRDSMKRQIKGGIDRKEFVSTVFKMTDGNAPNEVVIDSTVYQVLWKYIFNGLSVLGEGAYSNEEVEERIATSQMLVSARRNQSKHYGFGDDLENSAFQGLVYVIMTLNDWIEDDVITVSDVSTAYKIIVPSDLQTKLVPSKNKRIGDLVHVTFIEHGLNVDGEAVGVITSIMLRFAKVLNSMDDKNAKRIINRFMIACNPI